jgi:hypothetical protein
MRFQMPRMNVPRIAEPRLAMPHANTAFVSPQRNLPPQIRFGNTPPGPLTQTRFAGAQQPRPPSGLVHLLAQQLPAPATSAPRAGAAASSLSALGLLPGAPQGGPPTPTLPPPVTGATPYPQPPYTTQPTIGTQVNPVPYPPPGGAPGQTDVPYNPLPAPLGTLIGAEAPGGGPTYTSYAAAPSPLAAILMTMIGQKLNPSAPGVYSY